MSRALAKDHASENLLSAMHLSKEVRICMMIRIHSITRLQCSGSEHSFRLHINQVLMSVEEWYVQNICTSYPFTTAIAIRSSILVQWHYSLRTCFATTQLPLPPTPPPSPSVSPMMYLPIFSFPLRPTGVESADPWRLVRLAEGGVVDILLWEDGQTHGQEQSRKRQDKIRNSGTLGLSFYTVQFPFPFDTGSDNLK